ncbi:TIGR01244 family sulfur transferase [Sphingomicrobium flavum]|uniref:TIGR01244 family sulfur transferase n=1 Tax=Sphingomicrobium flavum TaxID=1229164 RepID=UPI0021AD7991|nr:TIGR01244 family sulfur transferase [Sphingomicrobium flavum]
MIGKTLDEKITVSPQIQPHDVAALKEAGVELIINNRPDGEEVGQPTSDEIAAVAAEHGIDYLHIPVVRGPSHADVEKMGDALAAHAGKQIHAYCRSGTRSTLTWAIAQAEAGCDREHIEQCVRGAGYDPAPIQHLL